MTLEGISALQRERRGKKRRPTTWLPAVIAKVEKSTDCERTCRERRMIGQMVWTMMSPRLPVLEQTPLIDVLASECFC